MRRMLQEYRGSRGMLLLGVLVLSVLVRLPLLPFKGFYSDMNIFVQWGLTIGAHPLHPYSTSAATAARTGYGPINYPPLAVYLYGGLIALYEHLGHAIPHGPSPVDYVALPLRGLTETLKLPALLGDLGMLAILYRLGLRLHSQQRVALAVLSYSLCPAVLLVGVLWGQLDTLATACILLAWLLLAEQHPIWGAVVFALGCLLKPNPAILAPLLFEYIWRVYGWRTTVRATLAMTATGVALSVIYLRPPHIELLDLYNNISLWLNFQPQTSVSAYNLWTILGLAPYSPRSAFLGIVTLSAIGWALFAAVLLVVCRGLWREPSPYRLLLGSGVLITAVFDVTTQQHERYIFPALALYLGAALVTRHNKTTWGLYAVSALTCTLNLLAFGVPHADASFWLFPDAVKALALLIDSRLAVAVAAANLALLVLALALFAAPDEDRATFEPDSQQHATIKVAPPLTSEGERAGAGTGAAR